MKTIRALISGCGKFSRDCLPGILAHSAFQVIAVVDPDERNRDAVGEMAKVPSSSRFSRDEDAFQAGSYDLAFIFSPVGAHAESCRVALEAGCCVSVAKPFVDSLADGRNLATLAGSKGLWISVWQNARSSPTGRALKSFVETGRLGVPAFGNYYTYRNRARNLAQYSVNERWPVINATAVHQFDYYRYLFDTEIESVSFRGCDAPWNPYRDPGVVTGWIELGNGLVISFFQSFVSKVNRGPEHPYTHGMIQGSEGALFWGGPWEQGPITFHRDDDQTITRVHQVDQDMTGQTAHYCQLLYSSFYEQADVFCDAADNLRSLAAVKAAELSAATGGSRIDVSEFMRSAGI